MSTRTSSLAFSIPFRTRSIVVLSKAMASRYLQGPQSLSQTYWLHEEGFVGCRTARPAHDMNETRQRERCCKGVSASAATYGPRGLDEQPIRLDVEVVEPGVCTYERSSRTHESQQ